MNDKTYNGWKNYQTWVTALWIDNDEATHNMRRRIAEQAIVKTRNDRSEHWTEREQARYTYADMLKTWVQDSLLPDLGASLASDLLRSAVDDVDFDEIASNWLDDDEAYSALSDER